MQLLIKKYWRYSLLSLLLLFCFSEKGNAQSTIVEKYGRLSVKGNYIIGEYGDTVQLRGMSMFWSQWMSQYYNNSTLKWLRDDWKCTVVRAAMGVEHGGYLENAFDEKLKIMKMVDAAISLGIYVVIDYHSHDAHNNPEAAKKFFSEMAKKYSKYPNVLYEIYNEPLQEISWSRQLRPYSETIIAAIRQYDPHNIIICGTRQWSQMVSEAAMNPVRDPNTMYTLHFYAASHKQSLRDEALKALKQGVAIFVTEFGTCEHTGDGFLDYVETQQWFDFMDEHKISWCNWSVSDKAETASILKAGARYTGKWKETDLTPSGLFIRNELIEKNGPIFNSLRAPDPKK
jgi:endoglucanase